MDPLSPSPLRPRPPATPADRLTGEGPIPSGDPLDEVELSPRQVPRQRILGDWLRQTARGALEVTAYMVGAGLGQLLVRLDERNRQACNGPHDSRPSEHMAPLAARLSESAAIVRTTLQSARGAAHDLVRPPLAFADRVHLRDLPNTSLASPETPVQTLDHEFCARLERSGWQGQSLMLAGDLEDRALLAWVEEGPEGRSLHLRGYLTEEGDRKMRAWMEGQASTSPRRGGLDIPRRSLDQGMLRETPETMHIPGGRRLELEPSEGVHMHYFPRVDDYHPSLALSAAPPASVQGQIELRLQGAQLRPEELQGLLEPLRSAGVVRGLATPQDLEALYLQKMARALGADTGPFQADFQGQPDQAGQILFARRHLSEFLGVSDVARLPDYDWTPGFDSLFAGTPQPGATAGWPRWDRFDASVFLGQELADWRLTHQVQGNEGAQVAGIIRSTCGLQCTEERLGRLGTAALGLSSMKDRRSGGARYAFTHLERSPQKATLVFSQDLLRRADQVGLRPGRFGQVYGGRDGLKTPLGAYHRTPIYEVMLKNSVSFLDYLEQVNLPSEEERLQVIQAFHDVGIRQIRGIAVEDLVRVVER